MSRLPVPRTAVRAGAAIGAVLALVLTGCTATNKDQGSGPSIASDGIALDSTGPGVTDDTITVSWSGTGDLEQLDQPYRDDAKAYLDAVVEEVNATGGIAGRTFVVADEDPGTELYDRRLQAYQDSNGLPLADPSNGKEACDAYEGADVFALLGPGLVDQPVGTPAAAVCLNAAGHPIINSGSSWSDADLAAAPYSRNFYATTEGTARAVAAGAVHAKLDPSAKTALITDTWDTRPDAVSTYERALSDAGFTSVEPVEIDPELSQAENLSAALRLKEAGYEQIVYLPGSMGDTLIPQNLFAAFTQQKYYPQQVLLDTPPFQEGDPIDENFLDTVHQYSTRRDLSFPTPEALAELEQTPGGQLCADAGKRVTSPTAQPNQGFCDQVAFLRASLDGVKAGEPLNAAVFTEGADALGSSYPSSRLYATTFTADKPYGSAGIVRTRYDTQCACDVVDSEVISF